MTTEEAFRLMLDSPYLWAKTGRSKASRRTYKHRAALGELPTLDTMEQIVSHACAVRQPKLWQLRD